MRALSRVPADNDDGANEHSHSLPGTADDSSDLQAQGAELDSKLDAVLARLCLPLTCLTNLHECTHLSHNNTSCTGVYHRSSTQAAAYRVYMLAQVLLLISTF